MTQTEMTKFVAKAVAQALKSTNRSVAREAAKQPFDAQSAIEKACKKRGFKNPVAKVNVLTYGKWIEKGFKVKPGEKSIECGTLRLFHEEQVAEITA